MLVLPLPLHLATSLAEWLLIYTTTLRLDAAYNATTITTAAATRIFDTIILGSGTGSSGVPGLWLLPGQLLLSLLCVVLLPTLGVARLQQQQRKFYEQMKAAHMQDSGQQQQQQQSQGQRVPAGALGNGSCAAAASSLATVNCEGQQQQQQFNDDSCFGMEPLSPKKKAPASSTSSASAEAFGLPDNAKSPPGSKAMPKPLQAAAQLEGREANSSSCASTGSRRGLRERMHMPSSRRDSAAEQFLADIESSMNMPAAAPGALAGRDHPPSSSSSSGSCHLTGLMPSISSLLGDE
ncbi:hypothetical protein COO60DRAFT_1699661, partial [Scenedesmus sp. NREL 46B-D3]